MVLSLEYLHNQGVVYRDFKPENILIDRQGYIRLTDFGLSKIGMHEDGRTKTFCGTLEYMAPEMIKNDNYNNSVDWFAFGLVLYEMLTGKSPFRFKKEMTIVDKMNAIVSVSDDEMPIPDSCSSESTDLLSKLLKQAPDERIGCWEAGATDIKQHPFFRGVDWDGLLLKRVVPPFIPETENDLDVQNVAQEFLTESIPSDFGQPLTFEPASADLRNTLTSLSEEKYKDFYYINSHNFFVSPKRTGPNQIKFQETSSVGSIEKEQENNENASHQSVSSGAEKNTKASQ